MPNTDYGRSRPIWFLMGPTACGKTELAVALCERFPFEVISVDSSMVYRGMDVGTAKPTSELLRACPHHLIDLREPYDTYSAADFCRDVHRLVEDIHRRGRYPLLVGGTMFYFRALEYGLPEAPAADPVLRSRLENRGRMEGWDKLYQELVKLDPERASQIRPTDRQRLQRALEIVLLTGKSSINALAGGIHGKVPICKLGLAPVDRAWLHARISTRFEGMVRDGLVEEVSKLLNEKKLSTELPALRMVGYRQVVQFLSGEVEYNEMVRRGIVATRRLAKRQLTWLRNQPGVTWVNCASSDLRGPMTTYIDSKMAAMGL